LVRFVGVSRHRPMKGFCKPNCKRTTRHSTVLGITSQDCPNENGEPEHTLSYRVTRASMRVLELENGCPGNRTVGSHPTLSTNVSRIAMNYGQLVKPNALDCQRFGGHLQTRCKAEASSLLAPVERQSRVFQDLRRVSSGGCLPSRMVAIMSGARKVRRKKTRQPYRELWVRSCQDFLVQFVRDQGSGRRPATDSEAKVPRCDCSFRCGGRGNRCVGPLRRRARRGHAGDSQRRAALSESSVWLLKASLAPVHGARSSGVRTAQPWAAGS
jgi:hypothetical protein